MKEKIKISPYIPIILSFLGLIIIGAILLVLPISYKNGHLSFIDALFMSTSSVCVTGLSVVKNVGLEMTIFGKIVMAILIEIGGLSFLTVAGFIMFITKQRVSLKASFLLKENINQESVKDITKSLRNIVLVALIIEGAGAILCFIALLIGYRDNYSFLEIVGISIFHTISSFNNAGFDIFGYETSFLNFNTDIFLNVITMVLIVLGGLSSSVILGLIRIRKWKRQTLNSKIILSTSLFLLVFGFVLIYLTSLKTDLGLLNSLFLSVSSRTAGFSPFDLNLLPNGTIAIIIILMFIGASPCSTGGGIKTTTVFVIFAAIKSFITGKDASAFNRRIKKDTISKAFTLVSLAVTAIFLMSFLLSLFELDKGFKELLFETFSAFATVGLSFGITPYLSLGGKIIIVLTMFMGRVGLLSLVNIINTRGDFDYPQSYHYIEENVLIG